MQTRVNVSTFISSNLALHGLDLFLTKAYKCKNRSDKKKMLRCLQKRCWCLMLCCYGNGWGKICVKMEDERWRLKREKEVSVKYFAFGEW